jgi:hypothetical protein
MILCAMALSPCNARTEVPPNPWRYHLPRLLRQRAMHLSATTRQMEAFAQKVQAGEPLRVLVVGGSFSTPYSEVGARVWVNQWADGVRAWLPRSNVSVHNAALGGTPPALARLCWEEFTRGEAHDLVIIEYAPNTHFTCGARYYRQ